jgi:signal transduction histidine kinase
LYDSKKVIAEISEKLKSTLNIQKIYEDIYLSLENAFHFKNFGILSYDEDKEIYTVAFNKSFNIGSQFIFSGDKNLHRLFIDKNKSIVIDDFKHMHPLKPSKELIDRLMELNVAVLTPLNIKNHTVGLMVLGEKESGDLYNEDDLQMLEIISSQAAIAIENARLYEEARQFNVRLQEEVKKATMDLRAANDRLKKLDEAKSEFISIASHQLRTPLTVIKGYISMILEKSFGELTPGEEESLGKVFESNERLIKLVENLLNISRIESGRLQFNWETMQLEDLVGSVFEELQSTAKSKRLKFTLKKPKKTLPAVKIDEEKVRQVVMNLTDNAIKYTKKGSVTVILSLEKDKKHIKFCVQDSGMGISPDDLDSLFKKFSRGSGTALIHTEGTGLGLYVAKQMIAAHKGSIWAESDGEGKGSRFCFVLPTV